MIRIIAIGKLTSYEKDWINEYLTRLSNVEIIEIKEMGDINKEGKKILELAKNFTLICLDEKGTQMDSISFSKVIKDRICFAIGGPDGLSTEVKNNCSQIISFSKMTFTHHMIRLFLLEQIYRGNMINSNRKYHR